MKGIEAKIVVLGSEGVGKTSLVVRYVSNVYTREIAPTIGASFFTCKVNLEDIKVKMQVWDTAGQERFRAMAPMYYRNANAALLVFDITKYKTFTEIKEWVQELQKNVQEPMVLTLVGNKSDLDEERAVSPQEAHSFATLIGGNYYETSAVKDQGIEQVFITTALGLIKMSNENRFSTMKRYESIDSLTNHLGFNHITNNGPSAIQIGIPVEDGSSSAVRVNGIGRLEPVSHSIDNIAHGNEYKGWCCY